MNHFKHPLCNACLTAPVGQEEDVGTLHVQQGYKEGYPCVRSFWKPDATDLLCLNAGAPLVLSLMGHTHAPLWLEVPNPDEGFPELPTFEHDEKLLSEMVKDLDSAIYQYGKKLNSPGEYHGLVVLQEKAKDIAKTYAMQILRRYGK